MKYNYTEQKKLTTRTTLSTAISFFTLLNAMTEIANPIAPGRVPENLVKIRDNRLNLPIVGTFPPLITELCISTDVTTHGVAYLPQFSRHTCHQLLYKARYLIDLMVAVFILSWMLLLGTVILPALAIVILVQPVVFLVMPILIFFSLFFLILKKTIIKVPPSTARTSVRQVSTTSDLESLTDQFIFERQAKFQMEENQLWKSLGSGLVKVMYDDDVLGYRVLLLGDHNVLISSTIIAVEATSYLEDCSAGWSAVDYCDSPPAKIKLRVTFSHINHLVEFDKIFRKGKEYAERAAISEVEMLSVEESADIKYQISLAPEWTKEQVGEWLVSHNMAQHVSRFESAHIDGNRLMNIQTKELKAILDSSIDRARMKGKIGELKLQMEEEKWRNGIAG